MIIQSATRGQSAASPTETANPQGLGENDFLKLLVAQLSHQDPLNPQEGSEFVAQLAQFSSLEQLNNVNTRLEDLAAAQLAATNGQAVQFVGKGVVHASDVVELTEGGVAVPLRYDLGGDARTISVRIVDKSGNTVKTLDAAPGRGVHTLEWNGKNNAGDPAAPGEYRLEVIAKDSEKNDIPVQVYGYGRVTGVTYQNGYPELLVGGKKVDLTKIVQITS